MIFRGILTSRIALPASRLHGIFDIGFERSVPRGHRFRETGGSGPGVLQNRLPVREITYWQEGSTIPELRNRTGDSISAQSNLYMRLKSPGVASALHHPLSHSHSFDCQTRFGTRPAGTGGLNEPMHTPKAEAE